MALPNLTVHRKHDDGEKNQEVFVGNPSDRRLLYFKDRTSASEKLPTNSGLWSPPCETVFQLSCPVATTVISVVGASCHLSTLTGLVTEAWAVEAGEKGEWGSG